MTYWCIEYICIFNFAHIPEDAFIHLFVVRGINFANLRIDAAQFQALKQRRASLPGEKEKSDDKDGNKADKVSDKEKIWVAINRPWLVIDQLNYQEKKDKEKAEKEKSDNHKKDWSDKLSMWSFPLSMQRQYFRGRWDLHNRHSELFDSDRSIWINSHLSSHKFSINSYLWINSFSWEYHTNLHMNK